MTHLSGCVLLLIGVLYLTHNTVDAKGGRCGDDPNTEMGCYPDYCNSICFRPSTCPETCSKKAGCQCVEGFKLDANKLKCVPKDQCTQPQLVPIRDEIEIA